MKNSPKQTLEKLLPVINDIFLSQNLNITAFWKKYHYKESCGFQLQMDKEIQEALIIHVNDPDEIAKRIFQHRWSLIIQNIDNILKTKFTITEWYSKEYFRKLKLLNTNK